MTTLTELTSTDGTEVLVNMSHVSVVTKFDNEDTRIVVNGKTIYVKEDYNEVRQILQELDMLA